MARVILDYLKKKTLNKWITRIYVSFFRSTARVKNGVLSHYRAERKKKLLNSDADFAFTRNFYLLPQTNTSTPHTHYRKAVNGAGIWGLFFTGTYLPQKSELAPS
jgi:hypothetical protein